MNKMIIRSIGVNLYAFQFFHWHDKEKVLEGRPWCFKNILLILNEANGDEQPEKVTLTHSPFWVRISDLPFNCRSDSDIRAITASFGEVLEIDNDDLGLERFRRVQKRYRLFSSLLKRTSIYIAPRCSKETKIYL